MIAEIFITVSLIWYWFAEGATEGFTWAGKERRRMNKLIRMSFSDKPENGIADYHAWRTFGENAGIVGAIIAAAIAGFSGASFYAGIAGWLIGLFVYQRALDYVVHGKLFSPVVKPYHILGFEIPRAGKLAEYGKLLLGVGAFITSFFV